MKIFDIFRMSIKNLVKRFLRTFMTISGVVIGTCAIIVMVSIGAGLDKSFQESLESMADLTTVNIHGLMNPETYENIDITAKHLEYLKSIPNVRSVTPQVSVYENIAIYTKNKELVYTGSVTGVNMSDVKDFGLSLESGTFPTDEQAKTHFLVGTGVAFDFKGVGKSFEDSYIERWSPDPETGEYKQNPPPFPASELELYISPAYIPLDRREDEEESGNNTGEMYMGGGMSVSREGGGTQEEEPDEFLQLFLENDDLVEQYQHSLTNSGVLQADDRYWELTQGILIDIILLDEILKQNYEINEKKEVYVPLKFQSITLRANSLDDVGEIEQYLKDANFNFWSFNESREQMQQQTRMIQLVLGGLAMVSLFVAAIGIFNTMVMAITERTKEIGVMKVLGCALGDIRMMFLIESAAIGFMGGIFGVGLSFAISYILNTVAGGLLGEITASMGGGGGVISIIETDLIVFALVFATSIGLVSGFLPAHRATKISSMEAINN